MIAGYTCVKCQRRMVAAGNPRVTTEMVDAGVCPQCFMQTNSCPKGGEHQWGTDGVHNNVYCKKCFCNKPR